MKSLRYSLNIDDSDVSTLMPTMQQAVKSSSGGTSKLVDCASEVSGKSRYERHSVLRPSCAMAVTLPKNSDLAASVIACLSPLASKKPEHLDSTISAAPCRHKPVRQQSPLFDLAEEIGSNYGLSALGSAALCIKVAAAASKDFLKSN